LHESARGTFVILDFVLEQYLRVSEMLRIIITYLAYHTLKYEYIGKRKIENGEWNRKNGIWKMEYESILI